MSYTITIEIKDFINHTFYEFKEDEILPVYSWEGMTIITKHNSLIFDFSYYLPVRERKFEELGDCICLYGQFKMRETEKEKPFIFVIVPSNVLGKPLGVIVSDQLYNYKPAVSVVNIYRELIGLEKLSHEKDLFEDLLPALEQCFPNKRYDLQMQPSPDDKRRITFGSDRVSLEYNARFGEFEKDTYVIPDFVLFDNKEMKKQIFIEIERKKRDPKKIKQKLWKLHYLDKKVYYIFEDEFVRDHFLEVIDEFTKEEYNGKCRKFKSLNYTTRAEFIYWHDLRAFTRFP